MIKKTLYISCKNFPFALFYFFITSYGYSQTKISNSSYFSKELEYKCDTVKKLLLKTNAPVEIHTEVVKEFKKRKFNVVTYFDLFPKTRQYTLEEVNRSILENGIDGIIDFNIIAQKGMYLGGILNPNPVAFLGGGGSATKSIELNFDMRYYRVSDLEKALFLVEGNDESFGGKGNQYKALTIGFCANTLVALRRKNLFVPSP